MPATGTRYAADMTSAQGGAFPVRHTWFVGGVLLLATIVLGTALAQPGPLLFGGGIIATACFSTSLMVFAFGIRGSESVTARHPLGTIALALLAVWVLAWLVVTDVLGSSGSADTLSSALVVFSYVDPYLRFALALIAVIQIGRAGVVPAPWNWAPAWTLAALTVPWLASTIIVAATTGGSAIRTLLVLSSVDTLARVASAVFLGVLAIVLADRSLRPQSDDALGVAAGPPRRRLGPLTDVDVRPHLRVAFRLAEHFTGDGCDFAGAEEQELEHVRDRVALGPLEVGVRHDSGEVPDLEEHRGERVRDVAAPNREHPVAVLHLALNDELLFEFRGVGWDAPRGR